MMKLFKPAVSLILTAILMSCNLMQNKLDVKVYETSAEVMINSQAIQTIIVRP
ncbi:MAG: hypothetical protein K9H49_14675 [Bacteroidales bacterium]|nr:hypothetical protein [Bacteroidales bacterium]MCF8390545.1 hypothetical protein [Bacteroidales bacterium]